MRARPAPRNSPDAEQVASEQLSLPLHPEMGPEDVDLVADAVHEWLRSR